MEKRQDLIMNKLREVIRPFLQENEKEIDFETRLVEDLNFDSLNLISVIAAIEEAFGIEFVDEFMLIDNLNSIANIYYFLEEHSNYGKQ